MEHEELDEEKLAEHRRARRSRKSLRRLQRITAAIQGAAKKPAAQEQDEPGDKQRRRKSA